MRILIGHVKDGFVDLLATSDPTTEQKKRDEEAQFLELKMYLKKLDHRNAGILARALTMFFHNLLPLELSLVYSPVHHG